MKMLSKTSLYALKSLLYLAEEKGNNFVSILQISESLDIPFFYLTKIFQLLSKNGLVESQKGAKGGVGIIKDIDSITIGEVIYAIEQYSVEDLFFDTFTEDKFSKLVHLLKYGNNDKYISIYETTLNNLLN